MSENSKQYNLEERTAKFGENVIDFCKPLRQDAITRPLISQLIRSSTGIGANYAEANSASSKRDFRNKMFIAKKEAQETKHWLRMIIKALPERRGSNVIMERGTGVNLDIWQNSFEFK